MIRKIHIILLCFLLLASCEGESGLSGGGAGNPLKECVMPSSASAGSEVAVQWNGFKEYAALTLVSETGDEQQVEISVITASGLIFIVPYNIPAGLYELVLDQDGRRSLGVLEVLEPEIPFTNIDLPSSAVCGEEVFISGLGFGSDVEVLLVSSSGEVISLTVSFTADGISFVLPEDLEEGEYEVYVRQNGMSWLLSSSLKVDSALVLKTLNSIRYYSPYIGDAEIMMEWDISTETPVNLTMSEYLIKAGMEPELNCYDRYTAVTETSFELSYDGFEVSNDIEMSYRFDENGLVNVSDVLIYGDDETTPFTWTYDSDALLIDISANKSFASFEYENGCLTYFRNFQFEYNDLSLQNNPAAADVIWAYMSLSSGRVDPFMYFPYLLGWYRPISPALPTAMKKPNPAGSGYVTLNLSYEFDEDGYVTEMSWSDSGSSERVEFDYSTGVIR